MRGLAFFFILPFVEKKYIKYLQGSIPQNSHMRTDLLFYYRLKPLYTSGYIPLTRSYLKDISVSLRESKQVVHNRFKKLLELGLLSPQCDKKGVLKGYKILSYNDLWKRQGFEKNKNNLGFKKGKKVAKFYFEKNRTKKQLLTSINNFEVTRKLENMQYRYSKSSKVHGEFVKLSCKGFSRACGYTSPIAGHKIKKTMLLQNKIEVQKPKDFCLGRKHIAKHVLDKQLEKSKGMFENKDYFVMDRDKFGFIYRRSCHLIALKPSNQKTFNEKKNDSSKDEIIQLH